MKKREQFAINYFQDEEDVFNSEVPAIRGCHAWGRTLPECYRNTVDAIESCLEARENIAASKLRRTRYAGLNVYQRPAHA